jgi:hypothetical protein
MVLDQSLGYRPQRASGLQFLLGHQKSLCTLFLKALTCSTRDRLDGLPRLVIKLNVIADIAVA